VLQRHALDDLHGEFSIANAFDLAGPRYPCDRAGHAYLQGIGRVEYTLQLPLALSLSPNHERDEASSGARIRRPSRGVAPTPGLETSRAKQSRVNLTGVR